MVLDARDKRLLDALLDGRFHSGAALTEMLGVSRAAVWKHLQALQALGLEVAALPGRGYRLLTPVEWLSPARITADLSGTAADLLTGLDIHDHLDSTNSELLRRARGDALAGLVCLAEYQSAGRGRIGRNWISPLGTNLYLSLLWRFDDPAQVAGLSLAVGVAVMRALAVANVPGVGLKWPNDILWGVAKLGGILLEVVGEAHGQCAVVIGLGLNRHLPGTAAATIDQPWTDLGRICDGHPPARNRLVALLLNELLPLLRDYPSHGLAPYLPEWRAGHVHAGHAASVQIGDRCFEGRILDVTDQGLLLFEEAGGDRRQFASGDLRLRIPGR